MGLEGEKTQPSHATAKFVLMTLEALWDEASSLPSPASLGIGPGHAGMRLLQTSSCRQHEEAADDGLCSASHLLFRVLPGRGLTQATFLGDCTGEDPGLGRGIQGVQSSHT